MGSNSVQEGGIFFEFDFGNFFGKTVVVVCKFNEEDYVLW